MKSSRSRSRSKNNRNRNTNNNSGANVLNRVFDSSGPEGKVRGTPQQIIDKYNQLARDAHLSNDRVAVENFQQHAEHYLRLLSEAQREMDQRREEQERQNRERQLERDREQRERVERQERHAATQAERAPAPADRAASDPAVAPQPDVVDAPVVGESGLVETPESQPKPKPKPRTRKPRPPKPQDQISEASSAPETPDAAE